MEEYLDELKSEIRRLINKVDNYLDDVLPDTYTEIGRYAERRSYDYFYREIDSYNIKVMLSSNFKKLSSDFLDLLYDELNVGLRNIERNSEENKDLTTLLERYNESIVEFSRNELKDIINRCMPNFIEEFRYEYKVNYESQSYVSWLENQTFELLSDTSLMISRCIDRQFEEIRDNYKYNYKDKIEKENEVKPLDEKYLIAEKRIEEFCQKHSDYVLNKKIYDAINKFLYYVNEFKNTQNLSSRDIQLLDLTMTTAEIACESIDKNLSLNNNESVMEVLEKDLDLGGIQDEPKTVVTPKPSNNNYSSTNSKSVMKLLEEKTKKDFEEMGLGFSEDAKSFASQFR